MPAVGAAKSWTLHPPLVEPLKLRRVPLLAAFACFALGDLLALRWQPPLYLAAATALLLAISVFSLRRTLRLAILPTYALWIAIGCWCAQIEPPIPQQQALQHLADSLSRQVRGTVIRVRTLPAQQKDISAPQLEFEPGAWDTETTTTDTQSPDTQSIDIDLQSVEVVTPDVSVMQPTSGGVRFTLSGPPLSLHCGDLIEVPLRLRTPDVYRDPGAWSYSDYLLSEGIGATASTRSTRVEIIRASHPTLRCRIFAAQAWASNRLQSFTASAASHKLPSALRLTPEDASMLNAMLFGDRTHLTQALRSSFERTGTFHLFVVSGLHVALLAAAFFWLLRRFRLPEGPAVLLTILIAFAYAELTGFGVPAQRAFIMTDAQACVSRNAPVRLVVITSSQSWRFMRSIRPSLVIPALLTRICTVPNSAMTAFAQALIDSSLATSSAKALAVPPAAAISAATAFSFSTFRAARATVAPALASSRAQARPMPCDAPVTRAILPESPLI